MKTYRVLLAGPLALALALSPTHAAPAQASESLEEVKALEASYDEAMSEFRKLYQEASSDEERQKLVEASYPDGGKYAADFLSLAREYPASEAAEKALTWVITRSGDAASISQSLRLLLENHVESAQLGKVCSALGRSITGEAESFLDAVAAKSPHREVQANACFTLAAVYKSQAEVLAKVKTDAATRTTYVGYYSEESIARLEKVAYEDLLVRAEKTYERVAKDFADVSGRRGTLGEAAERNLFEMRHLAIGKVAPEIEGEDVDGVTFKLSDYRGKVVVIDFWGDW